MLCPSLRFVGLSLGLGLCAAPLLAQSDAKNPPLGSPPKPNPVLWSELFSQLPWAPVPGTVNTPLPQIISQTKRDGSPTKPIELLQLDPLTTVAKLTPSEQEKREGEKRPRPAPPVSRPEIPPRENNPTEEALRRQLNELRNELEEIGRQKGFEQKARKEKEKLGAAMLKDQEKALETAKRELEALRKELTELRGKRASTEKSHPPSPGLLEKIKATEAAHKEAVALKEELSLLKARLTREEQGRMEMIKRLESTKANLMKKTSDLESELRAKSDMIQQMESFKNDQAKKANDLESELRAKNSELTELKRETTRLSTQMRFKENEKKIHDQMADSLRKQIEQLHRNMAESLQNQAKTIRDQERQKTDQMVKSLELQLQAERTRLEEITKKFASATQPKETPNHPIPQPGEFPRQGRPARGWPDMSSPLVQTHQELKKALEGLNQRIEAVETEQRILNAERNQVVKKMSGLEKEILFGSIQRSENPTPGRTEDPMGPRLEKLESSFGQLSQELKEIKELLRANLTKSSPPSLPPGGVPGSMYPFAPFGPGGVPNPGWNPGGPPPGYPMGPAAPTGRPTPPPKPTVPGSGRDH